MRDGLVNLLFEEFIIIVQLYFKLIDWKPYEKKMNFASLIRFSWPLFLLYKENTHRLGD